MKCFEITFGVIYIMILFRDLLTIFRDTTSTKKKQKTLLFFVCRKAGQKKSTSWKINSKLRCFFSKILNYKDSELSGLGFFTESSLAFSRILAASEGFSVNFPRNSGSSIPTFLVI